MPQIPPGLALHTVARAVTDAICSCLPVAPGAAPLMSQPAPEAHFWLMHPPASSPSLQVGPWRVICLAAIEAMDFGRKQLYRLGKEPVPLPGPPTSPQPEPIAHKAGRRAIARFWDILLDIAASHPPSPEDWAGVDSDHPILSIDPVHKRIRCVPPPALLP